jgi:hypothetical protein
LGVYPSVTAVSSGPVALPFGPNFYASYEDAFGDDRERLGLGGSNFNHFFKEVERNILDYPWIHSRVVPDSGGTLMRETRYSFPDIPALYVYYKVNPETGHVRFVGLTEAWSADELFPAPDF